MVDEELLCGYQEGLHDPKVGCWKCLEAFVDEVQHVIDEDGGNCPHPEGRRVRAAFRAWAEKVRVEHYG